DGFNVTTGPLSRVKIAAVLGTLAAHRLLNRARYWLPLSAATALKVKLGLVAPAMSLNVSPPSMLSCHCTVGAGLPLALALKVTLPGHTVWLDGFNVTTGPLSRVKIAAVLGTLAAHRLLNRARYWLPLSAATALKVKLGLVAPAMSLNVTPPSMLSCHCTVGAGLPLAVAVKVTLPGHTVWLAGFNVTTGPLSRVKIAAVLGTLAAHTLLKRARYWLPLSAATALKIKLGLVAPAMSLNVTPPSVLSCHWTVGAGLPLAAAVKVTLPGQTVWLDGFNVTTSPLSRVRVAAVLGTLAAHRLLNRARYWLPLSAATALKVKLGLVAPAMSLNVTPPSMLSCHCTVGAGLPLAVAVKVTLPGHTVWLAGFNVTTGPLSRVKIAAVLGTLAAHTLLKRARYWLPLSAATALKIKLGLVAPAMSLNVTPPSVLSCHWTVGAGLPLAAAVKVTLPGQTVWLDGFNVTTSPL